MYPSPAGATEALLPTEAWDGLVETNPRLRELEPDVETLLVNRSTASVNITARQSTNASDWSASCGQIGADYLEARNYGSRSVRFLTI